MRKIIRTRTDIDTINETDTDLYLRFKLSKNDYNRIIIKCPDLMSIMMPPAYLNYLTESVKLRCEIKGIELINGTIRGAGTYLE